MTQKMHGLLEKILEQNAREKRERIFHYCSYWGTWSRILLNERIETQGFYGVAYSTLIVEINLTPIPACYSSTWEKDVVPIVIREHGTFPDARDKFEKELPSEVIAQMHTFIGQELTQRLLTEDFLAQLDMEKLRKSMRGGGVPLAEVRK